jgi:hypothetical protein
MSTAFNANAVPTTPLQWSDYPEKMPPYLVGARVEVRRADEGGAFFPATIAQVSVRSDANGKGVFYSAIFEDKDFVEDIEARAVREVIAVGTNIESRFDGGADWFPGTLNGYNIDSGTYDVLFDDGDETLGANHSLVRREPWFFIKPEGQNNIELVDEMLQALLEENEEHAKDVQFKKHPVVSEYFDDESHYEGIWDKKLKAPSEKGIMYYGEGHVYGGGWKEGLRDGVGTCKYSDGSIYDGQWMEGDWHGNGRLDSAAGDWYRGTWSRGLRHGVGNAMWEASQNRYKGQWQHDHPHGMGTKVWPDGAKYVGVWENGKRHGFGEFRWNDREGSCVYRGHWREGLFDGVGMLVEGNGSRFEGEFVRGACEGYGVKRWPGGELYYYGRWKGGEHEGPGLKEFRSGALLDGMWTSSQPHGDTLLRFPDGTVYEVAMDHGTYSATHKVFASEEARALAYRRADADAKRAALAKAMAELGIGPGGGAADATALAAAGIQASALERQRAIRKAQKERSEAARAKALADAKLRESRGSEQAYAKARERGLPPGRGKLSALRAAQARARERAQRRPKLLAPDGSPLPSGSPRGDALAAGDALPTVGRVLPANRSPKPVLTPRELTQDESRLPSQVLDVYRA